jgi:hypothetical protein
LRLGGLAGDKSEFGQDNNRAKAQRRQVWRNWLISFIPMVSKTLRLSALAGDNPKSETPSSNQIQMIEPLQIPNDGFGVSNFVRRALSSAQE